MDPRAQAIRALGTYQDAPAMPNEMTDMDIEMDDDAAMDMSPVAPPPRPANAGGPRPGVPAPGRGKAPAAPANAQEAAARRLLASFASRGDYGPPSPQQMFPKYQPPVPAVGLPADPNATAR